MPATIAGIATAVPTHRILQSDSAEIGRSFACETADHERTFTAIFRLSGVEARHSVVLEASDGDLGLRQSFYGATSPTTGRRMEVYEAHAGPLATRCCRPA